MERAAWASPSREGEENMACSRTERKPTQGIRTTGMESLSGRGRRSEAGDVGEGLGIHPKGKERTSGWPGSHRPGVRADTHTHIL